MFLQVVRISISLKMRRTRDRNIWWQNSATCQRILNPLENIWGTAVTFLESSSSIHIHFIWNKMVLWKWGASNYASCCRERRLPLPNLNNSYSSSRRITRWEPKHLVPSPFLFRFFFVFFLCILFTHRYWASSGHPLIWSMNQKITFSRCRQ